jgi:hypothetical protein
MKFLRTFSVYIYLFEESKQLSQYSYEFDRRGSIPGMAGVSFYSTASRLALGPTQLFIQWAPGALSPLVKQRNVKLTAHICLVPRS